MPCINNAQNNITRVNPKMSDEFHDATTISNAKLSSTDCVNSINTYFNQPSDNSINLDINNVHNTIIQYQNNTLDNNEVSSSDAYCQTSAESEVTSLKEWLVLHNDLIQQQNDELLEKEKQIYVLQTENQMLKERLNCIEKGLPYPVIYKDEHKDENVVIQEQLVEEDSTICETDEAINVIDIQNCEEHTVTCSLEVLDAEILNHSNTSDIDIESHIDTTLLIEECVVNNPASAIKLDSVVDNNPNVSNECGVLSDEYNFTVSDNFCELDPMKNIKMSIRRKRVCSNSSAVSVSTEPAVNDEQSPFRRIKKKRKRSNKDPEILTSKEPYVTHSLDTIIDLQAVTEPEIPEVNTFANLEVPRWRIKHYTSCYTMEGTENLDDEVYNKRHMRLEIDERRRKRWDVQRIREQRVIDKLKLRQERIASGQKNDDRQESLTTLCPTVDDIKYLEIVDELPVSAFGHPIPKLPPAEFVIPWLNNPAVLIRKASTKRSTVRKRVRTRR